MVGGEKITRGVITKSVVAGMRTAVQIGLEDGKLSTSLLCSIGSALALGSSKELPFVATMNEQLLSILVNSAVVSLATKSGLLENVARIGLGDLLQTTAQHLGNGLANLTAAERMRRKSVEVFKRNPTINKNIDKSLSPSTGFREHQERIKKARLEAGHIKYKHYREPLLNKSFKANDNIKRDKTKVFEQKEKRLSDAPLAQLKYQRKQVRRSFEGVLEKVSSFAAEGFISLLGVLSEEARADELNDQEKVLLFSVSSNHKRFFAGRFLSEKHNKRSDFWAARHGAMGRKLSLSIKQILRIKGRIVFL